MKNSILIIATVVFSFLNVNATTLNTNPSTTTNVEITTNEIVQVYDWFVKTTNGEFSGTAKTLFDAKRRANLVGQNAVVIEQKISNYYVLKSEMTSKSSRYYFWEVQSEKGAAKGYSSSEYTAKKLLTLVASGDIVSYKIIKTGIYFK